MDVSAQIIREVEFREKLRGYHQDDVDDFLERVAVGLEVMQERLRVATDRAARAEAAVSGSREDDDSLRKTLVLAQRTADLAVKEATEQAALIVETAESEAAAMRAEAGEETRRLVDGAQMQARADVARLEAARRQLDQDVDRLVRYIDEHRGRAKALLVDAASNLDNALALPDRPLLSDVELDEERYEERDDEIDVDRDDESQSTIDRQLLAEVIERGRDEGGRPGWVEPQRPS